MQQLATINMTWTIYIIGDKFVFTIYLIENC